jgi:regulator of sigma E protease
VFSIGFGPKLVSRIDRRGTRWQVALLPLGGFVKFAGDMDPASAGRKDHEDDDPRSFHGAALWKRAATVIAGPISNFILAIAIFAILALVNGRPSNEPIIGATPEGSAIAEALQPGDRVLSMNGAPVKTFGNINALLIKAGGAPVEARIVRKGESLEVTFVQPTPAVIGMMQPGRAASRSGLLPGDRITSIDGRKIDSFRDLQLALASTGERERIEVGYVREGEKRVLSLAPDIVDRPHPETGEIVPQPTLGVSLAMPEGGVRPVMTTYGVPGALAFGVDKTVWVIEFTLGYLGDILFADGDASQIGGPVKIAEISGAQAEKGWFDLFYLVGMLSVSIGFMNLLPVPVLDGGHLAFYAKEVVCRRPASARLSAIANYAGATALLALMAFATWNDLS